MFVTGSLSCDEMCGIISVRIFLNWGSSQELIPILPVISSRSIFPKQYTSYAHVAVAGESAERERFLFVRRFKNVKC